MARESVTLIKSKSSAIRIVQFINISLRPHPTKFVNVRAVDFRGNLFGLRGSSLAAVTDENG